MNVPAHTQIRGAEGKPFSAGSQSRGFLENMPENLRHAHEQNDEVSDLLLVTATLKDAYSLLHK